MFTGLVSAVGEVASRERGSSGGDRLWLDLSGPGWVPVLGESIAVDGCCLTVAAVDESRAGFDVVPETLRRTTLGSRRPGDPVNLERPLRAGDPLGGHFVQGHVDAVSEVLERREAGDDVRLTVALPDALAGQVVEKGSVAVDGVSLTVASVEDGAFTVALIPHTLAATTLGRRVPGDAVNLEGDVLAKYVSRLVAR